MMKPDKTLRSVGWLGLAVLLIVGLAACGDDATNTPVATTAAATATTAVAQPATTPNANGNVSPGANPPAGGGNFPPGGFGGATPVSGTVASYDATGKMLTITTSDGQSKQYDVTNARVSKNAKVTQDAFGQALTADSFIQVAGTQGTDGSYSATAVTLVTAGNFGPGRNSGTPGAGRANGGTPGANGGVPGGPGANGTPGANGGPGGGRGNGQGRGGMIVQNAKLSGDTLTGTTPFGGQSVTVKLSSSTNFFEQQVGKLDDLQTGVNVTVNAAPAQNGGVEQAFIVQIR